MNLERLLNKVPKAVAVVVGFLMITGFGALHYYLAFRRF